MTADSLLRCAHCGAKVGRIEDDRVKFVAKSRLVALRLADGRVEVNCPECKKSTDLPLTADPTLVTALNTASNGGAPF